VGEHANARKSHQEKIGKLEDELAVLEKREAGETRLAAESAEKAAALAFDAAGGNRKALSEQAKHLAEKNEHILQAQNLEQIAAPVRQQLAAAEADLPRFMLSEAIESVLEQTPELAALSKKISEMIPPVAHAFGEFRKRTLAIVAASRPLLAGRADIQQLETAIQRSFSEGIRAQLHRDFGAEGYVLFGSLQGGSFEDVVRPKLENLLHALEVKLATHSAATSPGRAFFVAKTNVGGLLGMNVKVGETLSLPVDDPDVRRMVASGALEQVVEEKKGGAAA
jgi:hypothetical protein